MDDDLKSAQLLNLAVAHLRVAANTNAGASRVDCLMSARAVEIAWRDRQLEQALKNIESSADCTAIRSGRCDADAGIHHVLAALTAAAAYCVRPELLTAEERAALSQVGDI